MFKINNTFINGSFLKNKQKTYFDLINPSSEDIYGKLECTSIQNLEKAILSACNAEEECANLTIDNKKIFFYKSLMESLSEEKNLLKLSH